MSRLFGADGIRGIANSSLTPSVVLGIGRALAGQLRRETSDRPRAVVGRDPRPSGDLLESALVSGLCSGGADVISVGVMTTAGVAFLTRFFHADAGVSVTASHNPLQDNGLKVFNANGFKFTDSSEIALEKAAMIDGQSAPWPKGRDVGRVQHAHGSGREAYMAHLLQDMPRLEGISVVLDCANGAAASIAPEVFRRVGVRVREVGADTSGNFINCHVGATNPHFLVNELRCCETLGLAFDGDADRCIAVDEERTLLDGSDLLALLAVDMARRGVLPNRTIATTSMSNSGLTRSMAEHGIQVVETAVGDRPLLRTMLSGGFSFGGEYTGHLIFLEHSTTGDGLLTGLRCLELIARKGTPLRELSRIWRRTPEVRADVPVPRRDILDNSPAMTALIERERQRLGDSGKLVVRVSTIESVVRIVCEAPTQATAREIVGRVQFLLATLSRDDTDSSTDLEAP